MADDLITEDAVEVAIADGQLMAGFAAAVSTRRPLRSGLGAFWPRGL